jgi:Family of unknown function (DUF5519)
VNESQSASERITEAVSSWPGVTVGPGGRGASVAFRVGTRELGHLHGNRAAHFAFPKETWDALRRDNRIIPHPVFPDAIGPAARRIETDADVDEVIELLRLNYERIVERHGLPEAA